MAALPLAALALAGCQLRAQVGVQVDGDGGGELTVDVAADRQLQATARAAGADPLGHLARTAAQVPGWSVARRAGDGGAAVTLRAAFSGPEDLERLTTGFADGLSGPELAPLGPMRLQVTDDRLRLDTSAGLRVTRSVRELGLSRSRAQRVLRDNVTLRITVEMPGAVLETNADATPAPRTVEWTVTAGQRRDLMVTAERPWTFGRVVALLAGPYGLAALAILVALAALAALAALRRRRRHRDPPAPA